MKGSKSRVKDSWPGTGPSTHPTSTTTGSTKHAICKKQQVVSVHMNAVCKPSVNRLHSAADACLILSLKARTEWIPFQRERLSNRRFSCLLKSTKYQQPTLVKQNLPRVTKLPLK